MEIHGLDPETAAEVLIVIRESEQRAKGLTSSDTPRVSSGVHPEEDVLLQEEHVLQEHVLMRRVG
jgi:hypothetical protein